MAEKLAPKDPVTLDALAVSTMWETAALGELLERKGVLSRQEIYGAINKLRWRHPQGAALERPPRRAPR